MDEGYKKGGFASASYYDQIREERMYQMIKDPTKWPNNTRRLLQNNFGVSLPRPSKSRNSGRKSSGKLRYVHQYESPLDRNKNNYLASTELNPPISEKHLKNGLLDLINKDYLPKGVDLTDIMNHQPQLITSKPAQKHTFFERYERRPVQTFDYGQSISNLRLDINTTSFANSAKDKMTMPRKPQNAVSIVAIGAQDDMTVFANRESEARKTDRLEIAEMLLRSKEPVKRNFEAIMDEFSAHHIVVRPFTGVLSTPEFLSFQRTYEKLWGPIVTILQKITKLLQDYGCK
jgi:hypothetical protein